MPRLLAHKAGPAEGGYVRIVFRYDDQTTRTVLRDPATDESVAESTGTCRTDDDDRVIPAWWKPV